MVESKTPRRVDRRQMLRVGAGLGGSAALASLLPSWARSASPPSALPGTAKPSAVLSGPDVALTIAESHWSIDGRAAHAVTVNGTIPGPLIRLQEGQTARIAVTNRLREDTSIHWHGLLLPFHMDGVPGVSFPGIAPGQTFVYEFPVRHAGTFWYHSHSGLQEQQGLYGPLILDPAGADPVTYDREHVVVLSDFTFTHPHLVFRRLKQQPGYFNRQKQTLAGLLRGEGQSLKQRLEWAAMRMDPTDIADVTGSTFTYLINGHGPDDNLTALFTPGERVRLRFINAAAQTIFNVRIPGLAMNVVQADGNNVRPVEIDEFQIAPAENLRRDRPAGRPSGLHPGGGSQRPLGSRPRDADAASRHERRGAAAARAAARDHEGHGHGHGRPRRSWRRRCRNGHVHAQPEERAAGEDGARRADPLADAAGPHQRPRAGAGGRAAPGAGLYRPGRARSESGHAAALAHQGNPPDRQHGTLHVVVRWREAERGDGADPVPPERACAGHSGERHHDGAPHPSARALL